MSKWKECKLGEICTDISYGFTESANLKAVGPKFLRITDIVPNIINWDTVPYCVADKQAVDKYKLQNGDIVIARTGATTGYNKIIKNIDFDAIFASYLIRYKIDTTKAYPQYIGHVLQSSTWYDYIDAIAGGSAQPGANAKELGSFDILLPPLPEQRAIAGVLSSLDDKIELLHHQNKTLEGMAEALWRKMFVEDALSTWPVKKLAELCAITRGASPRPIIEYVKDGTVPWIKIADATASGSYFIDKTNEFIIEAGVSKSVKVTHSDLILSNSATCGLPYFVELEGCIHDGWLLFREFSGISKIFVFFFLKQLNEELNYIADGSVQNNLNTGLLKEYKLQVPPASLVKDFDSFGETVITRIRKNTIQIRTLECLRDTLLPKLMSGEVRVAL